MDRGLTIAQYIHQNTKYHSNQVIVFFYPKPKQMISSNGCVTHLREMFLKDHSVEVSFLGVWCIVWIHVLCMFQHAICHLHTKFCIPPNCLNFVFKNNWNYDKIFLFIFDSQLQQLLLKLIRSKNQKSIPSFSMVVTKFRYSQVMRIAALPSSPNLNFVPSRTLLLQFILPWKILTHPAWSNSHNFYGNVHPHVCKFLTHADCSEFKFVCVSQRETERWLPDWLHVPWDHQSSYSQLHH
jgi:hypothetical protein